MQNHFRFWVKLISVCIELALVLWNFNALTFLRNIFFSFTKPAHNYTLNKTLIILCDIKPENADSHERFRLFYVITTLVIPFFIIVAVNTAIGFELKKRRNLLLNDYIMYKEKACRRQSSWVSRLLRSGSSQNEARGKSISITEMVLLNAPIATISEANFSAENSTFYVQQESGNDRLHVDEKPAHASFTCSVNLLARYTLNFR